MKKKLIIVGVTVLLVSVWLSGCDENNNNNNNQLTEEERKFVGTWRWGDYNQLIFYSNKTGDYNNFLMTWEIEDGILTLNFITIVGNLSSDYYFSNNDRTLTLYSPDGEPVDYIKQ
jgi:hypothetical protein